MHPNTPWSAQESSASVGVRQTLSARSLLPAANSPPSGENPTDRIGCEPLITTVGTNLRDTSESGDKGNNNKKMLEMVQ